MDLYLVGSTDNDGESITVKRVVRPRAPRFLDDRQVEMIARSIEGYDHLGTNISAQGVSW